MTSHVDGNILAGPLSDLFRFDVTLASARCVSCGEVAMLAQAMVYVQPKAYIVRCSTCDDMLMTIIDEGDATQLDLSGLVWMHVPH